MRSRQRGATFLGMVSILAVLGFGLYGVIRVVPLYLEYTAVVRAMKQTAQEDGQSPQSMRSALDRRWAIEDITSLEPQDIEIKKVGTGYSMRAYYRAEAPFIANISLVADFDKTIKTGGEDLAGT